MKRTKCCGNETNLFVAATLFLVVSWSAAYAQSPESAASTATNAKSPAAATATDSNPTKPDVSRIDRSEFTYDGKPFEHWHKLLVTELKPERRLPALRAVIAFGANGYADEVTQDLIQLLNGYDEEDLERMGTMMEGMEGNGVGSDPEMMLGMALYSGMITAAAQKPEGAAPVEMPAAMPNLEALTAPMTEMQLLQTAMGAIVKVARRCSVDVLIQAANDDKSMGGMGRNAAISVLAAFRSDTSSAVPAVLKIVGNPAESEATRDMAIEALAELAPASDALLNTLKPLATSDNPKLRRWGISAYGKFGESAREAAPILTAALSDKDPQVVLKAAESLSKTDQLARSEAPKLLRLLSNRDESICNDAAIQLGEMGLFRAYRSGDLKEFGITRENLHDPQLVSGYIKIVERISGSTNYSSDVALSVLQILGSIGPGAIDAADSIRKVSANENQKAEHRKAAEEALVKITGSKQPIEE